jgi:hypothetical protein
MVIAIIISSALKGRLFHLGSLIKCRVPNYSSSSIFTMAATLPIFLHPSALVGDVLVGMVLWKPTLFFFFFFLSSFILFFLINPFPHMHAVLPFACPTLKLGRNSAAPVRRMSSRKGFATWHTFASGHTFVSMQHPGSKESTSLLLRVR